MLFEEIAVSAGERGHQMILPPDELVHLVDAKLVDIIV
jgi:prolyl-tRNA editing enzyme YbaK/EbsC (Cys-tRNA(Pro) deacylase)